METLAKPESIVDMPEFYNSSLQDVSNEFAPKILELTKWQKGFAEQEASLEVYLKEKQEEARRVLTEREQRILSVMRDAFPMVLEATDLPEQDKDLLLSTGKGLRLSASPKKVEAAVNAIDTNATSLDSREALRVALDGAIVLVAKKSDTRAKLQRSIRLAGECSSSPESFTAIRQVIDSKIFNELSSDFAWIDLKTSKQLTQNMQYSDTIGRKIMRLAHEHNVLKGVLRYSMTPHSDIENYVFTKGSKELMLEALSAKESETND